MGFTCILLGNDLLIKRLRIKNFAIITELDIDLRDGLTVITGETGAGKSIIMESLQIGIGGKATSNHVKSGADRSVIEITVDDKEIRRIIFPSGRTKSYINDEPISEPDFREKARRWIDFHGQHDQQYILDTSTHIRYLDRFAGCADMVQKAQDMFESIRRNRKKLSELKKRNNKALQQQELQVFQLGEIRAANIQSDEDIHLEKEARSLRHFDDITQNVQSLNDRLIEGDPSIVTHLVDMRKTMEKLASLDETFSPYLKELESTILSLQESANGMVQYVESLDHDPHRLAHLEDRITLLESLKRKYGGSLSAVHEKKTELESREESVELLSREIRETEARISELEEAFQTVADALHKKRVETIPSLEKTMAIEMERLNMPGAVFEIRIDQKADTQGFVLFKNHSVQSFEAGYDMVEFYLSANPGIPPKPLAKIASGGEVSRIMLALKTVFNESDPVDCLVFDEIDSGISGYTATRVAENLKSISKNRQVFCITHLPQIAVDSDHHLHITKDQEQQSPIVKTDYLSGGKRTVVLKSLTGNIDHG